jgi:hypothetical protein
MASQNVNITTTDSQTQTDSHFTMESRPFYQSTFWRDGITYSSASTFDKDTLYHQYKTFVNSGFSGKFYEFVRGTQVNILDRTHQPVSNTQPQLEVVGEAMPVHPTPTPTLDGFVYRSYGRAWLLYGPKSDERYGEKYLNLTDEVTGWWTPLQRGWIFKGRDLATLKNMGALHVKDRVVHATDTTVSDENEVVNEVVLLVKENSTLRDCVFRQHRRGLLLTAPEGWTAPKYLKLTDSVTGYWNETLKGWVFRSSARQELLDHGAMHLVSNRLLQEQRAALQAPPQVDSGECVTYPGFVYRSYGQGVLVHCPKSDSRYEQKSLMSNGTGWWIPKQRGWFFKLDDVEHLRSLGIRHVRERGTTAPVVEDEGVVMGNVEMVVEEEVEMVVEEEVEMMVEEDEDVEVEVEVVEDEVEMVEEVLDYDGFVFHRYGKGVMVHCRKTDRRYGQSYLFRDMAGNWQGWWNAGQRGWFFKTDQVPRLESLGMSRVGHQ